MMWKLDSASCKLQSPKVILPRSASNVSQFKLKIISGDFNPRYRRQYSTISNLAEMFLILCFLLTSKGKHSLMRSSFHLQTLVERSISLCMSFLIVGAICCQKKWRHVPSIIHTNWVLLAKKLYCARAVHTWVTPGILSNDSGEVIEIKVVSIQLRLKFIKLKPCFSRKALKISLSVNVNRILKLRFLLFLLVGSVVDNGHWSREKTKQSASFMQNNREIHHA